MSDVIGLDWLRMFSSKELSTLIAGAEHEINVADLQVRYLKYLLINFHKNIPYGQSSAKLQVIRSLGGH